MPDLPEFRVWPSEIRCNSSEDLVRMYETGHRGAMRDPAFEEEFKSGLEFQSYGEVADRFGLWGADAAIEEGLYLPYLHVVRAEAERLGIQGDLATLSADPRIDPWPERQTTGDCVSQWARNQYDCTRAAEIYSDLEPESWRVRTATEPIYGARGHSGEGANCSRLASWLVNAGGMLRTEHDIPGFGKLDLTNYNARIGMNWGGRGVPQAVATYAKPNALGSATFVKSIDEAVAAFKAGRCAGGCSGLGFSSTRNEDGVSEQTTSWAHAMYWGGLDARQETIRRYSGRLWLVQNSWGAWNRGPRTIRGTRYQIPVGSFWMRESAARRMIQGGGIMTYSRVAGWPALRMPDLGATGRI